MIARLASAAAAAVASVLAGRDPQVERAFAEVMKRLEGKKIGLPPMPPAPVKVPRP